MEQREIGARVPRETKNKQPLLIKILNGLYLWINVPSCNLEHGMCCMFTGSVAKTDADMKPGAVSSGGRDVNPEASCFMRVLVSLISVFSPQSFCLLFVSCLILALRN